jgi:calcineurin-like phosphoesterase family protein
MPAGTLPILIPLDQERAMSHQLSRRRMLASLGVACGALVLRPRCLQGAGEKLPEITFPVVTDTHLGYQGKDSAKGQWEKTAAELDAAPGPFVLHLGDVVDGGREEQYPIYLDVRKRIKKPVHEIPGNHDPLEKFAKHLRKTVDVAIEHEWLRVVLLGNAHTDSHDGFLSADQLKWLGEECAQAAKREQRLLLAMHVPAHTNANPDRGWYIKPENGQKELYALVQQHRDRVLALFHGHFHNGLRGWDDRAPVHEVVFPSALYNQDRKLEAAKAPGYNPDEFRAGYTQVRIKAGAIELAYKPVGAEVSVTKRLATSPE